MPIQTTDTLGAMYKTMGEGREIQWHMARIPVGGYMCTLSDRGTE